MIRHNDHHLDALNTASHAEFGLSYRDVVSGNDQINYQQTIRDSLQKSDALLQNPRHSSTQFLDLVPIKESGWTIPIGAHSDDKKKNVPLNAIEKPNSKFPDVHSHPESNFMDGKCGITGVSNMMRLYGKQYNPADIDTFSRRSWGPGMRVDKFAENCSELSGQTFHSRNIEKGKDPLDTLRAYIKDDKPVAVMYMCGASTAHWVVVTGITDTKDGPRLQMQSWGGYYDVAWKDIQYQWSRGYGGPYPHVVGDKASEILKKAKH